MVQKNTKYAQKKEIVPFQSNFTKIFGFRNENNENKLIINFEIEGYGESVDLIKNKIDNDMKLFIEGLL